MRRTSKMFYCQSHVSVDSLLSRM